MMKWYRPRGEPASPPKLQRDQLVEKLELARTAARKSLEAGLKTEVEEAKENGPLPKSGRWVLAPPKLVELRSNKPAFHGLMSDAKEKRRARKKKVDPGDLSWTTGSVRSKRFKRKRVFTAPATARKPRTVRQVTTARDLRQDEIEVFEKLKNMEVEKGGIRRSIREKKKVVIPNCLQGEEFFPGGKIPKGKGRVPCPRCGRSIFEYRLAVHRRTKYCRQVVKGRRDFRKKIRQAVKRRPSADFYVSDVDRLLMQRPDYLLAARTAVFNKFLNLSGPNGAPGRHRQPTKFEDALNTKREARVSLLIETDFLRSEPDFENIANPNSGFASRDVSMADPTQCTNELFWH